MSSTQNQNQQQNKQRKKQGEQVNQESKQKSSNVSDSGQNKGHRNNHRQHHRHHHRHHNSSRQKEHREYSQSKQDVQRRGGGHRHHQSNYRTQRRSYRDYSRDRSSDRYNKRGSSRRDNYSSKRHHNKYSDNQESDHHRHHHRHSSKRAKQDRKQRSRTRSPHPLIGKRQKPTKYHAYLQQQKRSDRQHAQEFWDGFQWVKKTDTNSQAAPGSSFGISGDPSRNLKIHVTGLPTDLGITAQDVREYFNQQILKNHPPVQKKSDQDAAFAKLTPDQKQLPKELLIQLGKIPPDIIVQNQVPVVEVQLMPQLNAATIQFSEPKMTAFAKQLNGNKILGQTMRIHGFADQIKFQNKHLVQLAAQRGIHAVIGEHNVGMSNQTTATATALALAAVKGLQGNDVNINMQALGMTAATSTASKIIKIFNLCERDQILPQTEYEEIRQDMLDEMQKFKGLIDVYVVKPGKEKLGMQKGSVFIEFNNIESAQSALNLMKGRTFDNRRVQAIYIPQQLWKNELKTQ